MSVTDWSWVALISSVVPALAAAVDAAVRRHRGLRLGDHVADLPKRIAEARPRQIEVTTREIRRAMRRVEQKEAQFQRAT